MCEQDDPCRCFCGRCSFCAKRRLVCCYLLRGQREGGVDRIWEKKQRRRLLSHIRSQNRGSLRKTDLSQQEFQNNQTFSYPEAQTARRSALRNNCRSGNGSNYLLISMTGCPFHAVGAVDLLLRNRAGFYDYDWAESTVWHGPVFAWYWRALAVFFWPPLASTAELVSLPR